MKNWNKVKELKSHHALEESVLFLPKMFYRPFGKEELYVSFFVSELQRGQDIYTEMVDRNFNSEDASRTLYKWNYNDLWATQYESTESDPVRYLVPVSELVKVQPAEEDLSDCIEGDCGLEEMTMKDLCAIIWKSPISAKQWLNDLINKQ